MSPLLSWFVLAAGVGTAPSSEEILARVADTNSKGRAVVYSGIREYRLRNTKFAKEATVVVSMTNGPGEGKKFRVLKRSGSAQLAWIVERLLASEADASANAKRGDHEISPANYRAYLRGTEITNGRACYVIELAPRRKSKYLIEGTLWVDATSYGVVRLQGSPSASVSMWVGTPQIMEEFIEIGGLWLPSRTRSVSSGRLLGTSELDIQYTDYQIKALDAAQAGLGSALYR